MPSVSPADVSHVGVNGAAYNAAIMALGSVTEDFRHQLSALGEKYMFVGVDPRGYGKSRPPERDFPTNYFERDAHDVAKAMEELGYDKVVL